MSFGIQQTHKLTDKPGNQSPPHTPVSRYSDAQKDPSWRGAALHAWGCFVFSHFCACAVRPSSITVSLPPASPQTPPRGTLQLIETCVKVSPVRSLLWFHVLLHSLALWYPLVAKQCGYCCYLRTYSAVAQHPIITGDTTHTLNNTPQPNNNGKEPEAPQHRKPVYFKLQGETDAWLY